MRDPSPSWDGRKIVFSAVIGAPTQRYEEPPATWQLYEMSGLTAGETPVITKLARQPADTNNVNPICGSDDRIIFASDRPRNGERHLYPQRDEYEEAPIVSGLWSLDPISGDLFLLNHTPSGAFTPSIDSFGRVIFTRWADGQSPDPSHTGLYRDPLPLSDGRLLASHTSETCGDRNEGSNEAPRSRYAFRLRLLSADAGGSYRAGEALTPGISKAVSYYDPDTLVSHDGPLWELNAVELRPRTRPARRISTLPAPERQVFADEGVDVASFQDYLRRNDLALMVSRNVTLRDQADRQQPYKLRIRGGASTAPGGGKVYDISHLQFFQGDQIRGIGGASNPQPGRRVLAQVMHEPRAANPFQGVKGAVALAADGSVAALVPAQRAMSWQLSNGEVPVVRERYWISFQKGEIRVCASCHGINQKSQAGSAESQAAPEDLRRLLRLYKAGLNLPDEDRVFNWAERQYPDNFLPKNAATGSALGYTYRYYKATDEYLGVKDGKAYYFKPGTSAAPQEVGPLQPYVDAARLAGY